MGLSNSRAMGKYRYLRMWKATRFGMGSRMGSKIVKKKHEIQYLQRRRGFAIHRYSMYWLTESWME